MLSSLQQVLGEKLVEVRASVLDGLIGLVLVDSEKNVFGHVEAHYNSSQ